MERRNFIYGLSGSIALTMLSCRKQKTDFAPEAIPKEFTKYSQNINFYTNYFFGNKSIGLDIITKEGFPVKINPYLNHPLSNSYINNSLQTEVFHLYDKYRFYKPKIDGNEIDLQVAKKLIFDKINIKLIDKHSVIILVDSLDSLSINYFSESFPDTFNFQKEFKNFDSNKVYLDFRKHQEKFNQENYFSFTEYPNGTKNNIPHKHFLEYWDERLVSNNLFIQQPVISAININSTSLVEFLFEYLFYIENKSIIEFENFFSFYKYLVNNYIKKNKVDIDFFEIIKKSFLLTNDTIQQLNDSEVLITDYRKNPYIEELQSLNQLRDNLIPKEISQVIINRNESKKQININEPYQYFENKWGLIIDLDKCNGCAHCVISCQIENNIPWVGKDQVEKNRDLNWIRIEKFIDNGKTVFLPLMCQHCDNAPCESVCPVNASTHSPDGLNEAVYNRCIGTRYCMANCPYKVRKFNFYQYSDNFSESHTNRMNPDVTIRQRGIAEKCTLCVQRLNQYKNSSKDKFVNTENLHTACSEVCNQKAIRLINYNNLSKTDIELINSNRAFHLLGDLNTQPSIIYIKS